MSYMDDLQVADATQAIERMEALRLSALAAGELIAAEDADSGQGASVYSSYTFAVRDSYMAARTARRVHKQASHD
jgi:hypothetical protein